MHTLRFFLLIIYRARLGCVNFNHAASPVEAKV